MTCKHEHKTYLGPQEVRGKKPLHLWNCMNCHSTVVGPEPGKKDAEPVVEPEKTPAPHKRYAPPSDEGEINMEDFRPKEGVPGQGYCPQCGEVVWPTAFKIVNGNAWFHCRKGHRTLGRNLRSKPLD